VIADLAAVGLTGIEVNHPQHDERERGRLRDLAGQLGLVVSGGSDDHGALTGFRIGSEVAADGAYEALVSQATGASPVTGT
jgi:3',5'-nucleoside bisphosphate phosphatase